MKFHITTGTKRLTISGGGGCFWEVMKVKGSMRRFSYRSFLPTVLILGVILPFLFIRTAFLALESASSCSSLDCFGRRFGPSIFGGRDASLGLVDELTRALMEANDRGVDENGIQSSPATFNELVTDITSGRQDIRGFAFETKAMLMKMERRVQLAKHQELIYRHYASYGIPKSMYCLCLRLAEEYSINALARSPLPPPESVFRLADTSYHHIALLTDNILAASVVISSAVANAANPENLVFHVVTDKKTYAPMHAWFALNSAAVAPAVVEVKGLHQFDWPHHVNIGVNGMMEIHRSSWQHYYKNLKEGKCDQLEEGELVKRLEDLNPSCLSLMNHLRIYLPELFPDLNKVIFLDDDVVVQQDLSPLWELDLDGKVVGAVVNSWNEREEKDRSYCSRGRKFGDYFNFSNSLMSSTFEYDRCAWSYGMNVFDLKAWRSTNITETYHHWLKLNLDSGFTLWQPGALPPALIAFEGHIHPIDPLWHAAGLGQQPLKINRKMVEAAAVIHFSGPAKPWLDIGIQELRGLWQTHINFTNEFIMNCKIMA
ncbi:probable galacturonosyltransferase 15 [Macadamia integrifolia]|uniref:probable galacturonosyltransferase 15 n=1 Tax=Macadamia integrifolia TaxID=60698 RepID=UPI001C4EF840|nr:probable galacturonosyltransferase 15 [Macadamia integrifolia]XP_042483813.1 probable galacturonosyltransferase 15 [Macadamia integrifolia]